MKLSNSFLVVLSWALCWLLLSSNTQPLQQYSAVAVHDSASPAVMDISPKSLTLTMDTSKWVMKQVNVLNRGGSAMHISKVIPSCACASGTILVNPVNPMELGKLLIRINTKNLKDSLNIIDFAIESDASNSAFTYRVSIVNPFFRNNR